MSVNKYSNSVQINPEICHGKPVFKGTRVMVQQVIELLESGYSKSQILNLYDTLPNDAVKIAKSYTSFVVKQNL